MIAPGADSPQMLAITGLRRVNGLVRETHLRVHRRNYRLLGRLTAAVAPIETIERVITTGVYTAVDAGLGLGARAVADSPVAGESGPWSERKWLSTAVGAVSGFYGDRVLEGVDSSMTVRHGGAELALTTADVATAFPGATPKLVVFLHGLAETEYVWFSGSRDSTPAESFGDRLHTELGLTPVWLRYNSGLSLAANAVSLIELIDELVRVWPVAVTQIVLVGHSMGGLVLHGALAAGAPWASMVSATVTLGTPFRGAALARAATTVNVHAGRLAETHWLHLMLEHLSAGVRDLRTGHDRGHQSEQAILGPGAHLFLAGMALPRRFSAIGRFIGDGLVTQHSAVGGPAYATTESRTVWGVHHQKLFRDERVYREIRDWLQGLHA